MKDYSISERCHLAKEDLREANEELETVIDWIPTDDVGLGGLEEEVYQEHSKYYDEAKKLQNRIYDKIAMNELIARPRGMDAVEEELDRAEELLDNYDQLF